MMTEEFAARKKLRIGHTSERGAVNACRTLLERHSLVVHEIDGRADYGRDLLIDLTLDGELTGAVAGIQVKGDRRFVRQDGPWMQLASPQDTRFWADSSIPVLGVLWDPATGVMRWINLTAFCRRPPVVPLGPSRHVEIPFVDILNDESVLDLIDATRNYIRQSSPTALLDLFGHDEGATLATVHDCFALGRVDPRAFILLRRSLLSLAGESLIRAIVLLSHLSAHPDIFWHDRNWVPERVSSHVRRTFRWSALEVHHLLRAVEDRVREGDGGWERGGLGQCLWHLLATDENLTEAATEAIGLFLRSDELDAAFRAMTLAQGRARDPRATVASLMAKFPQLAKHDLASEYLEQVKTYGWVPIY